MNIMFRTKYYTRKVLLTFLGPATLDAHNDPMNILERTRDETLGPRPKKTPKPHVRKRHFTDSLQRTS